MLNTTRPPHSRGTQPYHREMEVVAETLPCAREKELAAAIHEYWDVFSRERADKHGKDGFRQAHH